MTKIVDSIKLDKDNVEFNNAADLVRHTDKLIYLTGKAGTGKTTFLKYIKNTTNKNTVVLAPTGVAAINAGGVTINSFFQIPFGPFVPGDSRLRTTASPGSEQTIFTCFTYNKQKREIIKNLEVLIIDEVSMLRADMLDVIDKILGVFRNKPYLPFGGVQVLLIGDTFQLPPIADSQQWDILSQFYKTPFFFSSKVIEQNTPLYIELKKIYRQKKQKFIDLLNRVRVSQMNLQDFETLNAKYNPSFSGNGSDYIILATHNKIVNQTNLTKLYELKSDLFTYPATITGTFPDKHKPTDQELKLKVGAQIMFIKNDLGEHKRYYNGKIGKIKQLKESSITVVFDDQGEVEVERTEWENIKYSYDKEQQKIVEEVIGTFEQFPIRLAWAVTVHKSQGLTFEKVIADLGSAFAPGQVYVALSRCTSLKGLMLKTQLSQSAIKTDPRVLEFAKNETPGTLLTEQLNTGRADFNYKKARENLSGGRVGEAFDYFKKALKFRDDIETGAFQRFVKIQGERLLGYKEKYLRVSKLLESRKGEFEARGASLISQSLELKKKEEKIVQQNKAIELLLQKTEEFEAKSAKIEKQLKTTRRKLKRSREKISGLVSAHETAQAEKEKYAKQSKLNKLEIERIRGLRWFDKLMGKE